jgi:hypothetical protein
MVTSRASLPGPTFRMRVTLHAPRAFVYSWCTEFSPDDPKLEGESYDRRLVERRRGRVIFEDLEWTPDGWNLQRTVVNLRPPDRWSTVVTSSRVDVQAEYVLTPVRAGGTRLEITWRRRPKGRGGPRLSKARRERSALASWRRFSRALSADYRRSQGAG